MTSKLCCQLSFKNRDEIEKDGQAGCYHCLSEINANEINSWNNTDDGMTLICPYCMVDALVAVRHLSHLETHQVQAHLLRWRWQAWPWSREEDLESRIEKPQVINAILKASQPCQREQMYHELTSYLDGIDSKRHTSDKVQDDALYNAWQCREEDFDGVSEATAMDGINQDGDLHLAEYTQHCQRADFPVTSGCTHAVYTEVTVSLTMRLSKEEFRTLIGQIIGMNGMCLHWLTWQYGGQSIYWQEREADMTRDGYCEGSGESGGVFQVWAREEVMERVVTELQRHILATMRLYQRNYFRPKVADILYRYTPHRLVRLEFLLDDSQGWEKSLLYDTARECIGDAIRDFYRKFMPDKVDDVDDLLDKYESDDFIVVWERLYKSITNKYAPDGCRVYVCPCGIHHCPNYPPLDGPVYCDDCFEEGPSS